MGFPTENLCGFLFAEEDTHSTSVRLVQNHVSAR